MTKILTPSIAKKAAFTFDELGQYYFLGSGGGGGGGYGLSLKKEYNLNSFYLVGLLNSKLLDYIVKKNSTRFRGGFFAYNKQFIESLPIIIPSNKLQLDLSNQIISYAKAITEMNKKILSLSDSSRMELLNREINVYEEKTDEIVYELYGLNKEEKQLIESNYE